MSTDDPLGFVVACEHLDDEAIEAANTELLAALQADPELNAQLTDIFERTETGAFYEFLGFIYPYKLLAHIIPLNRVVVDVGCCNAFQALWFRRHKQYIGIDGLPVDERLQLPNTRHIVGRAQDVLDGLRTELACESVFAICNAVPDPECRWLVSRKFPNCFIDYPG